MFLNAKNGTVALPHGTMPYLAFGAGSPPLVLLPGIGLGLQSIKGMALPFALMYRVFAKEFRVYVFDHVHPMPAGHTTRQMAADLAAAMEQLGLRQAVAVGVSHGGMVAQWLAADHPEQVGRLVLAVTCACPNPVLRQSIAVWSELARRQDYGELMRDTGQRMYTDAYLRRAGWLLPLTGRLTAPKSPDRFLTMADSCLSHDATAALSGIACPALVLGGEQDKALSGDASRQLAALLPHAQLVMYEQYGHSLYEEAPDFNARVLQFARG